MQLKKINRFIEEYKRYLSNVGRDRVLFPFESQKNFQDNWDIEAADFGKMYAKSLENSQTRRWWTGDNFKPKWMMLAFIKMNSDFVRQMFRELFDENKPLDNRISKFKFACDILLQDYKEEEPLSIVNNHFHEENHVISMYLAFRFPAQYGVFFFEDFLAFMKKVGATQLPSAYDMVRFFKVCNTLQNFLLKDTDCLELHQNYLHHPLLYQEKSQLLATDFYRFVAHSDLT